MVEYLDLGSEIDYPTYNAIVYLLRKFKRLTNDLRLGDSVITTDYGTLSVTGGLVSLGGNFIIESPVTVSANNCLRNCFYSLHFTVIDRNLSGTVNRRVATVTGNTGETGDLEITIPTTFLDSDEVILPDFKLDIVFDEHEYYTPINVLNIELETNNIGISEGETITITATVTDKAEGNPVVGLNVPLKIGGVKYEAVTDSDGVATYTYVGSNQSREVFVKVVGQTISFYENYLIAKVTGNTIRLGGYIDEWVWLSTNGNVVIDWGDGTTNTVNNPKKPLVHNYSDGETNHDIIFLGNASIARNCFFDCAGLTEVILPNTSNLGVSGLKTCTSLTSVFIPGSVTSIGEACFYGCTSLASVNIPNSVTSIGRWGFYGCSALVDYQLYWEDSDSIIAYDSDKMPAGSSTVFTIPYGTTSKYTAKNYPSAKLVERSPVPDSLTLTADKPIIQTTETSTITATLTDNGQGIPDETLTYEIKHGDTTITTGSDTTDSNGEINITYTGTGTGEISIIVSYGTLLQESFVLLDTKSYDDGTKTVSDYWNNTSLLTRNDDSTTTFEASNWAMSSFKVNNTTTIPFTNGITVEFDVIEITGSPRINGNDGSHHGIVLSETGHYKVIFKDNLMSCSVDGGTPTDIAFDTTVSSFSVGFRSGSTVASVKFDNFLLY